MLRKIALSLMGAAVLATGTFAVSAAPAQAATGGTVFHQTDAGYDAPIAVRCGVTKQVAELNSSTEYCGSRGVTAIYVYAGTEVTCEYYTQRLGWLPKKFDTDSKWHDINAVPYRCVNGRD